MAKGRDLEFSILSDADKLNLDQPAADFDKLGQAAKDAGLDVDRVEEAVRRVELDKLGDEARDTARQVDKAFDTIARASTKSARKMDDDSDNIRRSLGDVRDEAGSTAREAAASFSGSGDISDAFQELAANAPSVLGPIGLAAGAAAATGVGLIRAEAEKLKELVGEMVDEMIEQGGKLGEEFVNAKLSEFAKDGTLEKLKQLADDAGISFAQLARSKAYDEEATESLSGSVDRQVSALISARDAGRQLTVDEEIRLMSLRAVQEELRGSARALGLAKEATENYSGAAIASAGIVERSTQAGARAWDEMSGRIRRNPATGRVIIKGPSAGDLSRVRNSMLRGIGTIVVPVAPGTPRTRNQSSNSRYRW